MSTIRKNLMEREGYTPYCGNDHCHYTSPRTTFNGEQFECKCGWKSEFDAEFIVKYKAKWDFDNNPHLLEMAEQENRIKDDIINETMANMIVHRNKPFPKDAPSCIIVTPEPIPGSYEHAVAAASRMPNLPNMHIEIVTKNSTDENPYYYLDYHYNNPMMGITSSLEKKNTH